MEHPRAFKTCPDSKLVASEAPSVPSALPTTRASRVPWLAGLVLVTACASQPSPKTSLPKPAASVARESSVPVHERGHNKLIAAIGSAGGTLELDNGARLEIPA